MNSTARKPDAADVKRAAAGRWKELLTALGGIDPELLDGKNHPCPLCGGTDRFRAIDIDRGALFCNQCHNQKNGDGIAALGWLCGWDFSTTMHALGDYLNMNSNGTTRTSKTTKASTSKTTGEIVATYDYHDEGGALLFQVCRFEPKDFRQRRPDGRGGWDWHVKGVRQVPYRLPELLADPTALVVVVEGEKDVNNLASIGVVATCNAGGAENWRPELNEHFAGRRVAILPDNDGTGRTHARKVAKELRDVAASIRIVALPGLPPKGDATDWIEGHGDAAEPEAIRNNLMRIIEAAPELDNYSANIERVSDVEPETLQWLWPGRVALGKLTLFAGDPGLGKSLITLDMAARVSAGFAWPDGHDPQPAGGVVLLSAEDDVADTIRPRLDAARADVRRITVLKGVKSIDEDGREVMRFFNLEHHLYALREAIERTPGCRLVIIDPVSSYCGKTDSHKNADVRSLLGPLAALAAELDVAIVCVTHLNKNAAGPAMYRSMGSLAFVAAARAGWAVVKAKDDPRRRLVLPIKNNLAADTWGLAYGIVEVDGQPVLAWETEPVCLTVDEALQPEKPGGRGGSRRLADDWLREVLGDGPVEAALIVESGRAQGFGEKAIQGAAKRLGVVKVREGFGPGAVWKWQLPATP